MSIFTHVFLGTNNKEKAKAFYDAVLAPLGVNNLGSFGEKGTMIYGVKGPSLFIGAPRDGGPATVANGGTVGFRAPNPEAVDAFHAAGLANGGTCEGEPGPREAVPNSYGAYLRDPDGNKVCAFCMLKS